MSLPVFPRLTPADLAGVDNGRLPDHLLVTVEMHGATHGAIPSSPELCVP